MSGSTGDNQVKQSAFAVARSFVHSSVGVVLAVATSLLMRDASAMETGQFVWDELGKRLEASQNAGSFR